MIRGSRKRMMIFKKNKIVLFFLLIASSAFAQQDLYLTLNNNRARPVALGGAYSSIEDNIVSATYNPASLNLYQREKSFRVTFFFNPITPTILFSEEGKTQNNQDYESDNRRYLKNAATLIKSIVFTAKFLDLGFIFNEQLINRNELQTQQVFFKNSDLFSNCYHTVIARIKLADRVSIGASANMYLKKNTVETERFYGFNYGILVKPSPKLNVGITYHYFPKTFSDARMELERLADQTINAGISYFPFKNSTLAVDLRNLTEEKGKSTFEAHFGFEQRLFSLIAFRAGFFNERPSNHPMVSAGIGLIDSNLLFSKENQFSQPDFMLNYTFAQKKESGQVYNWHLISVVLRF
ncbi:hypothetical protein H8E88_20300 [candidate division KSB1 bacterium]|nr:hypothetical protein [candidate division KSB1 bacterium]MBL7094494.1 hypothetical protein [candidate division KSB1 bacterium]